MDIILSLMNPLSGVTILMVALVTVLVRMMGPSSLDVEQKQKRFFPKLHRHSREISRRVKRARDQSRELVLMRMRTSINRVASIRKTVDIKFPGRKLATFRARFWRPQGEEARPHLIDQWRRRGEGLHLMPDFRQWRRRASERSRRFSPAYRVKQKLAQSLMSRLDGMQGGAMAHVLFQDRGAKKPLHRPTPALDGRKRGSTIFMRAVATVDDIKLTRDAGAIPQ